MKTIVVFGSSGKTGQEVTKTAIKNNFNVRTVERKNLFDKSEVDKAIKNSDAVVIVLGPRPPYKDVFCAKATELIVNAMKKNKVSRLICQTGAMIGDYYKNRGFFFQLMSNNFKKSSPEGYLDRINQEEVVKNSLLDWTIVKPPRLTDGNIKNLKIGTNLKVGLMSSISRKTLANFIIDELINNQFIGKAVFVKE